MSEWQKLFLLQSFWCKKHQRDGTIHNRRKQSSILVRHRDYTGLSPDPSTFLLGPTATTWVPDCLVVRGASYTAPSSGAPLSFSFPTWCEKKDRNLRSYVLKEAEPWNGRNRGTCITPWVREAHQPRTLRMGFMWARKKLRLYGSHDAFWRGFVTAALCPNRRKFSSTQRETGMKRSWLRIWSGW